MKVGIIVENSQSQDETTATMASRVHTVNMYTAGGLW